MPNNLKTSYEVKNDPYEKAKDVKIIRPINVEDLSTMSEIEAKLREKILKKIESWQKTVFNSEFNIARLSEVIAGKNMGILLLTNMLLGHPLIIGVVQCLIREDDRGLFLCRGEEALKELEEKNPRYITVSNIEVPLGKSIGVWFNSKGYTSVEKLAKIFQDSMVRDGARATIYSFEKVTPFGILRLRKELHRYDFIGELDLTVVI